MSSSRPKTVTQTRAPTLELDRLRVEVVSGPDKGSHLEFEETLRIGTAAMAGLQLSDKRVSGLHCELIVRSKNEVWVKDLGSKNGTFVGAVQVRDARLPESELLHLGQSQLRVVTTGHVVEVPLSSVPSFHGLIAHSVPMRALVSQLQRMASSKATVLVQGETGSGKEQLVRALHEAGPRANEPFIVVDCGAIAANLIESELFGYQRGAFTGADRAHVGAFQQAHRGTLFLDEVGELPLDLQPKLLRALEAGEVRPLGGAAMKTVDARIIAATHKDLALEVTRGRFRSDLYYRLAVVTLQMPPLRERREDIPVLAVKLLEELGFDPETCLTASALSSLLAYDWPGNVRELRNALERAGTLMQPFPSKAQVLAVPPVSSAVTSSLLEVPLRVAKSQAVEMLEREYVLAMLEACKGNVSEVARRSGMDRISIHRLMRRHGLQRSEGR